MDAEINLTQFVLGAQILNAQTSSIKNLFYVSAIAPDIGSSYRGGVPVIFPQFADRGPLVKHGFARNCLWTTEKILHTPQKASVLSSLQVSSSDLPGWSHSVKLILNTTLVEDSFEQSLSVINTGENPFLWTGGLHPYFLVDDLLMTRVLGLDMVSFQDRYSNLKTIINKENLTFSEDPCEKLFNQAPTLKLFNGLQNILISSTGFDQWMIWNPGVLNASKIPDMEDADWRRFICIEPVCINNPIKLMPGENFIGSFRVCW